MNIINKMDKKDKIVLTNILSTFLIKGIALIISFFSLPIYMRFFQDENALGVWYTILSVLTWFLTFDFGIGNGIRNRLVKSIEDENEVEIKQYISSGYIILFIISFVMLLIFTPILSLLNWNQLLNIGTISLKILTISMIINFVTIMLQFLLRLVTFINYSLQKSALNNFLTLLTTTIQVFTVLLLPSMSTETALITLSLVHLFATIFPLILATAYVFWKPLKKSKPSIKYFDKNKALEIFKDGGKIFINQIFYMLLTTTNVYLITIIISPSEVVEYQIYYKIFMLTSSLFMLTLTPLWSAVTKAHVQKDYVWIKKYFKMLLLLSGIVILFQFTLIIPLQFGFNIWLGENSPIVNYTSALIFAIFSGIFILQSTLSTFAMGFNKPFLQTVFYFIALILKFVLIISLLVSYKQWYVLVLIDIIIFIPYIIAEYIHIRNMINSNILVERNG